ncbi:hypothetical protein D3C85_1469890 [compost metagenome]
MIKAFTLPGHRAATMSAITPPIECPTSTAGAFNRLKNSALSSAKSCRRYVLGTHPDRPFPRRSNA